MGRSPGQLIVDLAHHPVDALVHQRPLILAVGHDDALAHLPGQLFKLQLHHPHALMVHKHEAAEPPGNPYQADVLGLLRIFLVTQPVTGAQLLGPVHPSLQAALLPFRQACLGVGLGPGGGDFHHFRRLVRAPDQELFQLIANLRRWQVVAGNRGQAILDHPQQLRQVDVAFRVVRVGQQRVDDRQIVLPQLTVRPLPDPGQRQQVPPAAVEQAQQGPGHPAPGQALVQHLGHRLLRFGHFLGALGRCGHPLDIAPVDQVLAVDQGVQFRHRLLEHPGVLLEFGGDLLDQLFHATTDHRVHPPALDPELGQPVHDAPHGAALVVEEGGVAHHHFQHRHLQLPDQGLGVVAQFRTFHHALEETVDHVQGLLLLLVEPVVTTGAHTLDHPLQQRLVCGRRLGSLELEFLQLALEFAGGQGTGMGGEGHRRLVTPGPTAGRQGGHQVPDGGERGLGRLSMPPEGLAGGTGVGSGRAHRRRRCGHALGSRLGCFTPWWRRIGRFRLRLLHRLFTQILAQVQVRQHSVPDQNVVQLLVEGPQLLQDSLLEGLEAHLLNLAGQFQLSQPGMKGLAHQRRPERVVVAGGVGNPQLVQPELELQQVAPVQGIRLGHHDPQGKPVLELALVHHRQLRTG